MSRTPEEIYAELNRAWATPPSSDGPDWPPLIAEHADRVAALWSELHAAALASHAPYWAVAAALFAHARAEEYAEKMREHANWAAERRPS